MSYYGNLRHLLHILWVFVRYGIDDLIGIGQLPWPIRSVIKASPWRWFRDLSKPRGQRLREALQELGPVFVKFGQILSTRPDLLPEDIARELTLLQDQVPPFSAAAAKKVVEKAYGETLDTHFQVFEAEAFASASVAQVHLAKLLDGTEVVVKVLRPGMKAIIRRDLKLLYLLAGLANKYWSEGPRLRPVEVIGEFDKTIHDELDLMREAANASQLRLNFSQSDLIYVPEVYWDHTRHEVMVMERIHGISIRNITALNDAGIDMRKLAHNGVEIFFTQAFRDGFFHADMHPGNIFVGDDGQYKAVDFGIMGTLSNEDQDYLAENFLAFFHRDYRAVAEAHVRAGWVPPDTRVEDFEAAIRTVCEPIFAKPISEISFGRLLVSLFSTARRFNMPVQPQLVLLQKTFLNIEGLGRQLYPQLDLWETAKPFLERWMRKRVGPGALLETLRRESRKWSRTLPEVPMLIHDSLQRLRRHELEMQQQSHAIEELRRQLARSHRNLVFAISGGVLLAIAAYYGGLDGPELVRWKHLPVVTWVTGVAGILVLGRAWFSGRE